MSKILFLADLHGNMPATLALEKEIEKIKPDLIWFLGDAIGKGPESDKTCDWVREHCDKHLSGNWDLFIAGLARECPPEMQMMEFYFNSTIKKELLFLMFQL